MSAPVLLRQVPGDTVIHRLWAGTKLMSVVIIGLTLSLVPSWSVIGLCTALLLVTALIARVPRSVLPHVPWWLWVALLIGGLLNALAGIDAVWVYLRVTVLSVVILAASAMVGWTTPVAEVAPAFARLGAPLRRLRVPVDEWAVTIALCLRSVPLLIEELRVLNAARRLRPRPPRQRSPRGWVAEAIDLLAAVMAVSARRASELGLAITARGGTGQLTAHRTPLRLADLVAIMVVLVVCVPAAILL
ncbi:MAG: energy-coupling factor transporter transmembrane protein EcfT [Mycobacteriaceae bacterium]